MGVVFLVAALHNPNGWGRYVYAVLIGVASLATIGVAADHLYVQSLPEGAVPSCGAPLGMLFQFSPWLDVVKKVLTGSGECQEVNWQFLGLAMPAWVLIWALALGVAGVLANVRAAGCAAAWRSLPSTGAPESAFSSEPSSRPINDTRFMPPGD